MDVYGELVDVLLEGWRHQDYFEGQFGELEGSDFYLAFVFVVFY